MLGLFNMFFGRPEAVSEKDVVLGRLQKQATKNSDNATNRDEINDLDVLNHKHRAVLLSKDLSTERDRWPKLRTQTAMNNATGDGFWDRAVGTQSEAQRNKAQILSSMKVSRLV
jgi:hypothetical protein